MFCKIPSMNHGGENQLRNHMIQMQKYSLLFFVGFFFLISCLFSEMWTFVSQRVKEYFFYFLVHCWQVYLFLVELISLGEPSLLPTKLMVFILKSGILHLPGLFSWSQMMTSSPKQDVFPEPRVEKKYVFTCLQQLFLFGRWIVFLRW